MSQQYRPVHVRDHALYTGHLVEWFNAINWLDEPVYTPVLSVSESPLFDDIYRVTQSDGTVVSVNGGYWLYYAVPRIVCAVCGEYTDHQDHGVCPACMLNAARALFGAAWTWYCAIDSQYTGVNIAHTLSEFQVLSSLDYYWSAVDKWIDEYRVNAYNADHDV